MRCVRLRWVPIPAYRSLDQSAPSSGEKSALDTLMGRVQSVRMREQDKGIGEERRRESDMRRQHSRPTTTTTSWIAALSRVLLARVLLDLEVDQGMLERGVRAHLSLLHPLHQLHGALFHLGVLVQPPLRARLERDTHLPHTDAHTFVRS